MTGTVRVARDGHLGWVTIDNPERRNALTAEMFRALGAAVVELDADADVRVIVVRGAGDRAFAAGADIGDLGAGVRAPSPSGTAQPLFEADKPVVAMIHGACIGGGLLLALHADLRLAADDAKFGIPAIRLGVAYPYDGARRLVGAVGPAAAAEILLTGAVFEAADALRWGLISRVVAKPDLEQAVVATATAIASGAPLSVRASAASVRAAVAGSPPAAVAVAEEAIRACWTSDDLSEGQRAFAEKRPPLFTGR